MQDHEHSETTDNRQRRYLFTAKHHGADRNAAQWRPDLTESDEFAVFNSADGNEENEFSDEDGNLYGALREGEDSLRELGMFQEQIAEFPCTADGRPWHGYPHWAINQEGPSNRRNQKHRPANRVFDRMLRVGLINRSMRARLMKGDHV
jgi:hypothetical protein